MTAASTTSTDALASGPAAAGRPLPQALAAGLAAAALVTPLEFVAVATFRHGGWQDLAARAPVASLLVLVLVGASIAAARSGARLLLAAALGAGVLVCRAAVSAYLGMPWFDPLSTASPVGGGLSAPAAWSAALAAVAIGASRGRVLRAAPRFALAATGIVGAALCAAVAPPAAAVVGSLAVAIALAGAVLRRTGTITPDELARSPFGAFAIGVAVATLAIGPHAVRFVLERYAERTAVVGDTIVTVGPVLPPALWSACLVAAVGSLIGAVAAGVVLGRRLGVRVGLGRLASPAMLVPPVLGAAFLLRIAAVYTVSNSRRDVGDPYFYHVTANLLARGRGFEEPLTWVAGGTELASALHGPAFPAALSLVSRLGGVTYADHQWASVVLGLPQVAFAVLLAHALAGRRAAVLAAAASIAYPNMWLTDGLLYVEGLMAGFTTAATFLLYRWLQHPRRSTVVAVGVLIGLAALTRGEALLLIPLFLGLVVLAVRTLPWRQRLIHAAWGTLGAIATLVPWMAYNAPRFEVFVPLSTNSNEVLFYANCDDVYSGELIGFWSFACQTRHRETIGEPPGDQAQKAVYWREQAVQYMREHADRLPAVLAARVGRQWELFRPSQTLDLAFVETRDRDAVRVGQLAYYAMMPLAVVGSLALRRRGVRLLPMWAHAISVTVTALYAYGTLRFRAPWEPIMVVLASAGVVAAWDALRRRKAAA